ncbi:MAG TPA: CoA pyrophosphatase [Bacteroidales bacterium]|nr:CoA pyrophosphatase [Bacteroidales bacterium]
MINNKFNIKEIIQMLDQLRSELKLLLTQPLPGIKAQTIMAPAGRDLKEKYTNPVKGAVMILLFEKENELFTIFIRRPDYDGVHSGQVAFPGGKFEAEDPDLIHTALRETYEEIGVKPEAIEVLGKLSPLYIPVSNIEVQPVVGFLNSQPLLDLNSAEVRYIIIEKVSDFFKPEILSTLQFSMEVGKIEAPAYHVSNELIWGATAMIFSEFLTVLKNTSFTVRL